MKTSYLDQQTPGWMSLLISLRYVSVSTLDRLYDIGRICSCSLQQYFAKNHLRSKLGMVFYLPKYNLDFVFINFYFVKYYLDSKLGKIPILCTVSVNMKTSISKLGRYTKFVTNESMPLYIISKKYHVVY